MYRILIVEDDPGIAEGLRQLMENWGLEAFVARNFQDILGEFRACQPHLVLLISLCPFSTAITGAASSGSFPGCPSFFSPPPGII